MIIWKYAIGLIPETIKMPANAIVRHVGSKNGTVTLWVEVDETLPEDESRTFFIIGTGHVLLNKTNIVYIGTAMVDPFVWHVYERVEK